MKIEISVKSDREDIYGKNRKRAKIAYKIVT